MRGTTRLLAATLLGGAAVALYFLAFRIPDPGPGTAGDQAMAPARASPTPPPAAQSPRTTEPAQAPVGSDEELRESRPSSENASASEAETGGPELTGTKAIFAVFQTGVVMYAPPGPDFHKLLAIIQPYAENAPAWSGDYPAPRYAFTLVGADFQARILIGDGWLGDGSTLIPIQEQDFRTVAHIVEGRRLAGPLVSIEDYRNYLAAARSPAP